MSRTHTPIPTKKLLTGVPELDMVLRGGLPEGRVHLLEGEPGTGKTTLALKFLIEGASGGQPGLYVTMSESEEELRSTCAAHGWDLAGIDIFEVIPDEAEQNSQQTVILPSEVELSATIEQILDRIEQVNPSRVVIDSCAELRLLASDRLLYRRQILALKRVLQGRGTTSLLLDDLTTEAAAKDLHSVVHGVISLEQHERNYGAARRRLRVPKMRGADFQSGWHDFAIQTGEILVFPSLIADEHGANFEHESVQSGLCALDELLGGGLDRGTVTMLVGSSGTGKTSLALRFAIAAVSRKEHVAYFSFDETFETWHARGQALGLDIGHAVESKQMSWERANPSRLSPGEFVWRVRRAVEDQGAKIVVIDSMNSYLSTMPEEKSLILQMHELLSYLNNQGVVTLLILAQQGVISDVSNPIDLSFLSDTIVLLRYFEAFGEVRKAISVVKKRTGVHELAIREYRLFPDGMRVGPRLLEFQGVMTGNPSYTGEAKALLKDAGTATG